MCRQVADYSRQCWIVFFVLFGNSVEKIPEGYKRDFVNGLRETLGIIGAPIRLSMRAGNENPYAPKKQQGRREVLSVMAGRVPAIHETSRVSCCLGDRTLSGGWHKDVDGRDAPGHDETGDAASNEKPRRVGRSRWSSEEARANRLRKTEYVLYLSHSRSLTSAVLQKVEARGKGQEKRR
jgi:hypothetical protein